MWVFALLLVFLCIFLLVTPCERDEVGFRWFFAILCITAAYSLA